MHLGHAPPPPFGTPVGTVAVEPLVRSIIALILQLKLFYPDRTLVFLARDMEYHFFVHQQLRRSRLLSDRAAVLLHVSRTSARAAGVSEYLSDHLPTRNAPYLVVDSGFHGSIIAAIRAAAPRLDLVGHLLCSFNPRLPGSDYALCFLERNPPSWHSELRQLVQARIEHLPHRHRKVEQFHRRHGMTLPVLVEANEAWRAAEGELREAILSTLATPRLLTWIMLERARINRLAELLDFKPTKPTEILAAGAIAAEIRVPATDDGARLAAIVAILGKGGGLAWGAAERAIARVGWRQKPIEAFDRAAGQQGISLARVADGVLELDPFPLDTAALAAVCADEAGRALVRDMLKVEASGSLERPVHPVRMRQLWRSLAPFDAVPPRLGQEGV